MVDCETFTVALLVNPWNDAVTLVAGPVPTAMAKPLDVTVTSLVFPEVQVADDVTFPVVPFEYVAVAVNCWVPPTTRFAEVGVTAIDVTGKAVAVKAADPLLP